MTPQRIRWVAFALNGAASLANGVLAGMHTEHWPVHAAAAAFHWTLAYFNSPFKENSHGRHREAEAGSHDPGAGPDDAEGAAGYATGGTLGPSSGLTYTFSIPPASMASIIQMATQETAPPVEHVQSDMPIFAHRIAKLRLDGRGTPFVPLNHGNPFGREAVAACHRGDTYSFGGVSTLTWGRGTSSSTHTAPALGCRCGFYSLPVDVEPWDTGAGYVTLQVELSGTVIEHERGYRASHQYVLEARMEPCPYCAAPSEVALFDETVFTAATCRAHVIPDRILVEFDDLARVLRVPVVAAPSPETEGGPK